MDGIREIIGRIADGRMGDDKATEFLRVVFDDGLAQDELVEMTLAMRDSGTKIDWIDDIARRVVDKHSTGGVGDKVSISLAPALAACGAAVPMISGRALGHTGGTLDKLESIPGFDTEMTFLELKNQVIEIGLAIVGQNQDLVPADRRMYALRDLTGLIASVPLITSSIISKKAAEGITSLVLDVKTGKGAFMQSQEQAEKLARSMKEIAESIGITTTCLVTSMDHPIGYAVGNSLEIIESVETLCGRGPADLEELVCIQGGVLLGSIGLAEDNEHGAVMIQDSLYDGTAYSKFLQMVSAQGGNPEIFSSDHSLMQALGILDEDLLSFEIKAEQSGWVRDIDAMRVAELCLGLGAGRSEIGGHIDHSVGMLLNVSVGSPIMRGQSLATVYHRGFDEKGMLAVREGFQISEDKPDVASRILEMF